KEAEAAARQKAQAEADLQRELGVEEARTKARQSGLEDQYVNLLENRIEQNWIRPPSAQKGLDCWVNVTQIPSGEVISVSVEQCNGDDAVVQSIERAVRRASPLPLPPVEALFERNLRFEFKPDQ
ncbi:MAG TPA: cell envelope integrity protein TolA, partial [Gammaproteobacteria bacterium]|nr:cell envelope integrity protein TolA [Gammaproteobacteria bacterium]